uniref:Uncharacterized protein n=1 Tax=Cajanus cajan TaxID=3821 RepID=A0A151RT10_CAJCA|nr:hypothetical protein KK1_032747 [Cajanus cajan]KYP45705.1 hypothetical protein KK1_032759 [Cajanus cajan]
MPKVKHFQNPLKSAPQPQQDANPLTQAHAHSSPAMNLRELSPSIEVPSNVSPPIDSSPTNDVSHEETPQEEFPQEAPTSRRTDRESLQHWNVDAIGKTGMHKCYFDDCYLTILKFLETGQNPSRGTLFIETKTIGEQIEVGLTQSTTDEYEISPNDIVGRAFGPEHSRRVRCMGMGAAPTNTFRNTILRISDLSLSSSNVASSSSCSNQCKQKFTLLESQLQGTLNALKAYMIMKEGNILDELASFFLSQVKYYDLLFGD